MTENAYFGQNLAFFGPKFLILTEGSKSFGTHLREKQPRHLVGIVLWLSMGPNWPKIPIFGQEKVNFGPNLAVYGPKILFFMEVSKIFGTHIMENHLSAKHLVCIVFWSSVGPNGPKMPVLGQKS